MHPEAWSWLSKQVDKVGKVSSIVDIGGRNNNGTPRDLFPGVEYTAVDFVEGDDVDIVCDAAEWVPDREWDMAICTEMFEHLPPDKYKPILSNINMALRANGVLLFTAATDPRRPHSAWGAPDPGPEEFYENVDVEKLKLDMQSSGWFVDELVVDRRHGDVYVRAINMF
jgi:SAM-dependent methyltransferase